MTATNDPTATVQRRFAAFGADRYMWIDVTGPR